MKNFTLIGQIKGAKAVTRKNKSTGVESSECEVIIQIEDYDKNGELVLDTDTVQFQLSELANFKANINKFIAVPYLFISSPKGTYLFPDDSMNFQIYDSNPLVINNTKKAS